MYCIRRGFSERVADGGPDYLIRRWEGAVNAIEKQVYIDHDYRNAMDTRQILYELIPTLSDAAWSTIAERLQLADKRLRDLTVPTERCIIRSGTRANEVLTPETHWWYFIRPKHFGSGWEF